MTGTRTAGQLPRAGGEYAHHPDSRLAGGPPGGVDEHHVPAGVSGEHADGIDGAGPRTGVGVGGKRPLRGHVRGRVRCPRGGACEGPSPDSRATPHRRRLSCRWYAHSACCTAVVGGL